MLLEGAKRIGKSTIVEEFAKNEYDDYLILDFARESYEEDLAKYDEENKVYLRSMCDEAHVDLITGKQYTAKNIIIAYIDNSYISNDDKGRQNIDNIGSGIGYYITDGYAIPITWSKSGRKEQTVYKKKNGEEIKVNDGNTYIQNAPSNSATIS